MNFSNSCDPLYSFKAIVSRSIFMESLNSCLDTFLLASSAIGSYNAFVLFVTTLSTNGLIPAKTFCSNLDCLAPLIGSLPNFLAIAAFSAAKLFIVDISAANSVFCSGVSVFENDTPSFNPASERSTFSKAAAAFSVNLPCSALASNSFTKL